MGALPGSPRDKCHCAKRIRNIQQNYALGSVAFREVRGGMGRALWGRGMTVLAAATIVTAAVVVGGRVLMSPAVGRAPAVVAVATSEPGPLSPPPPGFPDLTGFTDVSHSHEVT